MNEQKFGLNQSVARKMNNILVVEELRKKPVSGTELSEILHLSNATTSSIIKGLFENNIIRLYSQDSVNGLGRKRVKYTINENYCLMVVVSYSSYQLHVVISDITFNTLYESKSEIKEYSLDSLKSTFDSIKEVIGRPQFRNLPVKCMVISCPGLINTKTGELQTGPQFSQEFIKTENILEYPKKLFNCPIILQNDTKLMMEAELENGEFKGRDNGMLAYVDYGIGGAFEFGGKLYLGSRGYAGEVGRLKIDIDGEITTVDDVASLRSIKETLLKETSKVYKTADIVNAFKEGDELVKKLVLRSAKAIGLMVNEVIDVFDIEQFTISGRVSEFGDAYLEEIIKEAKKNNPNVIVRFSKLDSDAIVRGGKATAGIEIIKSALNSL